jgi:hypothetical protein
MYVMEEGENTKVNKGLHCYWFSLLAWLQNSLIYRLNKRLKTTVQRDKLKVKNMVVWVEEWLDRGMAHG